MSNNSKILTKITDSLNLLLEYYRIHKPKNKKFLNAIIKIQEIESSLQISDSDKETKKKAVELLKIAKGKKPGERFYASDLKIGNCRPAVDEDGRTYYVKIDKNNQATRKATYNNDICFEECYVEKDPKTGRSYFINAKTGKSFWNEQECNNTIASVINLPEQLSATPNTFKNTQAGAGINNDVDLLVERLNNSESNDSLPELLSDTPSSEIYN